jgi:hypothetical protein
VTCLIWDIDSAPCAPQRNEQSSAAENRIDKKKYLRPLFKRTALHRKAHRRKILHRRTCQYSPQSPEGNAAEAAAEAEQVRYEQQCRELKFRYSIHDTPQQ